VVEENPDAQHFESWLLDYSQSRHSSGAVAAMARAVLEEWRLAHAMGDFKTWLDRGAPSDDVNAAYQVRAVTHRFTKATGFVTVVEFRSLET